MPTILCILSEIYFKRFRITLRIRILFSMIVITAMVGIKYSRNTAMYNGFKIAFPIRAATTASMAINKDRAPALSGRGSRERLTFNKILPSPNKAITARNDIVYTPASVSSLPCVINRIEIHRIKNEIMMR